MNWAVIMAGGSGTRFWPESRQHLPKQFLALFGKKTLLEQTFDRLRRIVPRERIIVFVACDKVTLTRKLLGLPGSQVIGEPVGRNTAPCAVWAASLVMRRDPSAILGIFPADHYIRDTKKFQSALQKAYRSAGQKGMPVTLGILPDAPHTGYGYLEIGRKAGGGLFYLKKFHEKPGHAAARRYFRSGRFLWNAGIFVWRADCLLETARTFLPDIFRGVIRIASGGMSASGVKNIFSKLKGVSIDYGLMEKIPGHILTIPVSMGWNDVGGWASLRKLLVKTHGGNVASGKTLLVESSGNFIKSDKKLIAAVGLRNHVVIETKDAILVCPMEKTEDIRKITASLKSRKLNRFL